MAKSHYITRQQLEAEIISSKQRQKEHQDWTPSQCFTPKLTEYLILLVNRYANKGQWRGYSYIDDMKSDALVTLCQNCFKYDETRFDNPFGYLTQIVKYCFITFLEKEEVVRDIKDSLWESIGMTPSYTRQIKNEMMKNVVDQSAKGMKALKKDAEVLSQRIETLSLITSKLNRGGEYDFDVDMKIAEVLEIEFLPFTSCLQAAITLFDNPPIYDVQENVEIAGQKANCLSVYDESTRSNTKRIISNTDNETVVRALCSIGLTVRRDLLVKRLREMTGYNITSTRMPVQQNSFTQTDVEYGDDPRLTQDILPQPQKKKRKRNVE